MKTMIIVLSVLAVIALPLLFLMFYGMSDIKKLVIHEADLSQLKDGTYSGSFHKGRWTYDVLVTVQDHRITAVKNTNQRMDMAKQINADLEAKMLEKQAIDIDVVSGATINSKAFEKAVELALSTAPRSPKSGK